MHYTMQLDSACTPLLPTFFLLLQIPLYLVKAVYVFDDLMIRNLYQVNSIILL